jgi:hypothetical protein
VVVIVVMLTTLPYIAAQYAGGAEYEFGGFLLNPIDGNTYLAKMRQGWEGHWRAKLPYTAEAGEGAYLFTFYLTLGHLARLSGLSILLTFHLARVAGTIFLLLALYRYFRKILPADQTITYPFLLAALGSGLGWIAVPFGGFTSDFWVAEAYPFLSAYANPHFPVSLGLMLWMLLPNTSSSGGEAGKFLGGILLMVISPFGVIVVAGVLGAQALISLRQGGPLPRWIVSRLGWVIVGSGVVGIYIFWVVQTDPVFAGWNAQNLTPSPPIIDLILSFSPALILGFFGVRRLVREKSLTHTDLLIWAGLVLLLIYLPINLQRRLLIGFFIPLAGLAYLGIRSMEKARFRLIFWVIFFLSIPTNILILLAAVHGIQTYSPALYLTRSEGNAFDWINEATDSEALILAAPDTGLFIPAHTGRRVIYGHPFETVNAQKEAETVEAVLRGDLPVAEVMAFLSDRRVEYIFWGPRERTLGGHFPLSGLSIAYENSGVTIYAVEP